MNRHTRVHAQQRPENISDRTQRSAACLQCATSRVRCTRGDPCARCESKGLSCERRIRPSKEQAMSSEENRMPETDAILDPQVLQTGKTPTRSLEPTTIMGDDAVWARNPPAPDTRGANSLDSGMICDLEMYGIDPIDGMAPRPLSVINWLSPDDRSLQEWASQLAGIPDCDVFPATFAMPDVLALPQLLNTEPTLGWAPASQPSTDHAQMDTQGGMRSFPQRTERESPETLMDGESSRGSQTTSNRYYVNGNSWRAPLQSRFCKGQAMDPGDRASVTTSAPSSASIASVANMDGTVSSLSTWLAEDVYASIVLGVEEETRASAHIPSLQAFRLCVHLYFERLHPNFPFLSRTAFLSEKPHWILSLAVAGVGAGYLRSSQGSQWKETLMQALGGILSRQLHQFQRQVDTAQPASDLFETANQVEELLPLIQAKVLHLLCMLHRSMPYISQGAAFERAHLVQWCLYLNLVPDSVGVSASRTGSEDIQQWTKAQSSLRTGMMIWVS